VTHLADFWSKCGVFKLTMSAPSLHYRDYFVGDYGKWLMSQSNLWQVGAQYLLTVPVRLLFFFFFFSDPTVFVFTQHLSLVEREGVC